MAARTGRGAGEAGCRGTSLTVRAQQKECRTDLGWGGGVLHGEAGSDRRRREGGGRELVEKESPLLAHHGYSGLHIFFSMTVETLHLLLTGQRAHC